MIPSANEIASSIYGVWRLAHLDQSAMQYFNRTPDGFWRSFFAAVITLPGYVILMAINFQGQTVTAEPTKAVIILALTYVMAWTAVPLMMHSLTKAMGRPKEYIAYIVAINWAQVLVMLVYVPVVGIEASGFLPAGIGGALSFFTLMLLLAFEGYVAHTALKIGGLASAGVVLLTFVVVQVIGSIGFSMIA